MNKFLATAAAACIAFAGSVSASTISISAFSITDYNNAVGFTNFDTQDFEDLGATMFPESDTVGGLIGGSLDTNVGTFESAGGKGTGEACIPSGDCAADLYLKKDITFGQGNMVPFDGSWSLNSNDTLGIIWEVVRESGAMFNRVVFGLMDAADQGAIVEVEVGTSFAQLENRPDKEMKLIVIDFAQLVSSATVRITNANFVINPDGTVSGNDGFSIDGAGVGVVPLPASGLLLLTGFGALALYRRRKQANA